MMALTHTVQAGDTVSAIARRYGVPTSSVTGYRSGNANVINPGEVLNIGSAPTPPANTINAGNLNSQPYTVPTPATATGYYAASGMIKNTQDRITAYTAKTDQGEKDITATNDKLSGEPTRRIDLYKSEGVDTAHKELLDFQSSMRSKEQAYLAKVDRIRSNNPNGAYQAGQEIELDKASKDHAIESAADAITAEYKMGNYTNAKSIVDTLVDAETEGLKTKLNGLEFFYNKNENNLTDSQKTLLEQQTSDLRDQYNEAKDLRTKIGDLQLKVAEAGGTPAQIAAVGKSSDLTGATQLASNVIGGGGGNFTTTQLNSGASNAGTSTQEFTGLDKDVKNYFINNSESVKIFNQALADIKSGDSTVQEAKDSINSSNLPASVKTYLNSRFDAASTTSGASGGFWSGVGSFFGSAWKGISSRL